jgi:hypothetical protein
MQLTTGRNADAGLNFFPAFRHLNMIFQHQITRITPSAAVYGRAGFIRVLCLQCGRAGCMFIFFEKPGRPASGQSGTGLNKIPTPEPVRYRMPKC